ncbi:uncharacterized protein KD926_011559 [Aspergillus affinis]|uniref:uncharacterized protein n=1 Tax=Aspergillus affinis TaxID=1070780 RepID=UPI0022FE50EA|nr:uncharacterized protein KD926_011559 [Aspergillus affinis]KAI9037856.1 hypothetical protein KD926_011559 [Aspergillus affinis]
MAPVRPQPSLNPTVEDVDDGAGHAASSGDNAVNEKQLSWPEQKPKNNAFSAVQDKNTSSRSDTPLSTPTSSNQTSSSRSSRSKERKKRRGQDEVNAAPDDDLAGAGMSRSQKRKRIDVTLPGDDDSVRNVTPISMETEDISEAVQQRLNIKEERKKQKAKPGKRKRDSLASNGSASSPGTTSKPRKKAKFSKGGAGDEGTSGATATGNSVKRIRRSDGISDSDSTTAALRGTKRQKQTSVLYTN